MKLPLIWDPLAIEDVTESAAWYTERSQRASDRFMAALGETLARIEKSPNSFPAGRKGTRRALIRKFPYSVVYVESPEGIEIFAVAHGKRREGYWVERLP